MMQLKGCNSYSTISENKQPNAEDLIDIFPKKTQMTDRHMKKCTYHDYTAHRNVPGINTSVNK